MQNPKIRLSRPIWFTPETFWHRKWLKFFPHKNIFLEKGLKVSSRTKYLRWSSRLFSHVSVFLCCDKTLRRKFSCFSRFSSRSNASLPVLGIHLFCPMQWRAIQAAVVVLRYSMRVHRLRVHSLRVPNAIWCWTFLPPWLVTFSEMFHHSVVQLYALKYS